MNSSQPDRVRGDPESVSHSQSTAVTGNTRQGPTSLTYGTFRLAAAERRNSSGLHVTLCARRNRHLPPIAIIRTPTSSSRPPAPTAPSTGKPSPSSCNPNGNSNRPQPRPPRDQPSKGRPAGSPPSPKATARRACSGPPTAPWNRPAADLNPWPPGFGGRAGDRHPHALSSAWARCAQDRAPSRRKVPRAWVGTGLASLIRRRRRSLRHGRGVAGPARMATGPHQQADRRTGSCQFRLCSARARKDAATDEEPREAKPQVSLHVGGVLAGHGKPGD